MVRTGKLEPGPDGGVSLGGRPKRVRKTQWREVRLSLVETLGGGERRYAAAIGPPQRTGEQMFALALQHGYGDDTWVHGVGDGAPWIAQQVASVFPRQRFLLDRCHLLEHLHEGASALSPGDAAAARAWVSVQASRIDQGEVSGVVAECRSRSGANVEHPLYRLAGYLENRQGQMDYAAARREGLPIGSGAVEGGHRSVIQDRLKLPGTWWKEETVNPMLALRSLRANKSVGSLLELIPTASSHTQVSALVGWPWPGYGEFEGIPYCPPVRPDKNAAGPNMSRLG